MEKPPIDVQAAAILSWGYVTCVTPCFIRSADEEFVPAHQLADEHKASGKDLYSSALSIPGTQVQGHNAA